MTEPHVTLGHQVDPENLSAPLGAPLQLSTDGLVGMHTCVVANARSGKSGLIRMLLEQTSAMQRVILDGEDEFYTLAEGGDFVVIGGKDGAAPATPANAAAIALMVLESGINVVIQLNRLPIEDQQEFIANFLDAVMAAPDELWHPILFVIDEAHRYAPQDSAPVSRKAIHELTSRGGKRGFTAVLATQRLAKIDKDVTGDCNNWFMGRNGQDTDRQAACKAMGFRPSSSEGKGLLTLPPRHFWAFGVATEPVPTLFRVDTTSTTIPKAGQQKLPMPPTSDALAPMMEALRAAAAPPPAPVPAEDRAPVGATLSEVGEVLQHVTDYIHQPSYNAGAGQGHFDGYQEGMTVGEAYGSAAVIGQIRVHLSALQATLYEDLSLEGKQEVDRLAKGEGGAQWIPMGGHNCKPPSAEEIDAFKDVMADTSGTAYPEPETHIPPAPVHIPGRERRARAKQADQAVSGNIAAQTTPTAARAMLEALSKVHPARLTWAQVAGLANRKPKGGSFNAARKWMLDEETVDDNGQTLGLTATGMEIAPPPTSGESKLEIWLRAMKAMPPPAADILQHVYDHPGITVPDLAEALGRQPKGGSWNAGMSTVRRNGLVEADDDGFLFCTDLVKD